MSAYGLRAFSVRLPYKIDSALVSVFIARSHRMQNDRVATTRSDGVTCAAYA